MSEKQPKLKFEEEKERTATRSPPKKSKVEQSVPKKQKLKQDADKAAEKSQHLRFGKAEITPDEASRMTKQQKRAMYAAAAARSAVHREVDQYEDDTAAYVSSIRHSIYRKQKHTERINDTNLFITNLLKFCTLLYKLCASHHPRQRD